MKYRILYPTVCTSQGVEGLAGDIVTVAPELAKALCADGALEPENVKPPVERATAAPGEKRGE